MQIVLSENVLMKCPRDTEGPVRLWTEELEGEVFDVFVRVKAKAPYTDSVPTK